MCTGMGTHWGCVGLSARYSAISMYHGHCYIDSILYCLRECQQRSCCSPHKYSFKINTRHTRMLTPDASLCISWVESQCSNAQNIMLHLTTLYRKFVIYGNTREPCRVARSDRATAHALTFNIITCNMYLALWAKCRYFGAQTDTPISATQYCEMRLFVHALNSWYCIDGHIVMV